MVEQRILVAGATGGVGQLVVANLVAQGIPTWVLARSVEKAQALFGDRVTPIAGDLRNLPPLPEVSHIICCTGTTAFPSPKWDFDLPAEPLTWGRIYFDAEYRRSHSRNSPMQVDGQGVANLIAAAPRSLERFVFVSSCGVDRKDQFPYSALNAYGVLDAKQQGETTLRQSGLPYSIIRPGRLIDGPFTSSDLNTLLQATTQGKLGVVIGTGDTLNGQTSRIDVAAACVACLGDTNTLNQTFELVNQGDRPAAIDWTILFSQIA